MTTLFVRHKVIDYPAWRRVYDDFDETRRQMGVKAAAVYRAPDDPRDVTVTHDFATLDAAQAFADSRELAEAMSKAGVDGKPNIWFAEPA